MSKEYQEIEVEIGNPSSEDHQIDSIRIEVLKEEVNHQTIERICKERYPSCVVRAWRLVLEPEAKQSINDEF